MLGLSRLLEAAHFTHVSFDPQGVVILIPAFGSLQSGLCDPPRVAEAQNEERPVSNKGGNGPCVRMVAGKEGARHILLVSHFNVEVEGKEANGDVEDLDQRVLLVEDVVYEVTYLPCESLSQHHQGYLLHHLGKLFEEEPSE
eukprot:CAMPEP_0170568104 /NCGR_PEP_ID=MMETSP0211-20121228/80927_1 /TAXON_ID=311385 /ORGANISM="Pseudokeronopsis sp., Strain OXSARD2" /LENGTH=141 /DNA_ID=CAMNT_0010889789 /DNA_START=665 /DNA_END=1087 /DNA_ORIENTATION=+